MAFNVPIVNRMCSANGLSICFNKASPSAVILAITIRRSEQPLVRSTSLPPSIRSRSRVMSESCVIMRSAI